MLAASRFRRLLSLALSLLLMIATFHIHPEPRIASAEGGDEIEREEAVTNTEDGQLIVDKDELGSAHAALAKLKPSERRKATALQWMLPWELKGIGAPTWRKVMEPEPLGLEVFNKRHRLPPWVCLRTAALLRMGYPMTEELTRAVRVFCNQEAYNEKEDDWSWLAAQFIAAEAIRSRTKDFEKEFEIDAKLKKRVDGLIRHADWQSQDNKLETPNDAGELFCESLSRVIVQQNEWGKLPHWDKQLEAFKEVSVRITRLPGMAKTNAEAGVWEDSLRYLLMFTVLTLIDRDEAAKETEWGEFTLSRVERGTKGFAAQLEERKKDKLGAGSHLGLLPMFQLIAGHEETRELVALVDVESEAAYASFDQRYLHYPYRLDFGLSHVLRWQGTHEDIELRREKWQQPQHSGVVPTCLAMLAESGGFLAPRRTKVDRALNDRKLANLRRNTCLIEASLVHRNEFKARVDHALKISGEWLQRQQKSDGFFEGTYGNMLGGHMLCLLALLDAGISRDDPSIEKGLKAAFERFDANMHKDARRTYDICISLMFFQRYYEKEQEASGMLKAATREAYLEAAAKVQEAMKEPHRAFVNGAAKWLVKDYADYGWCYTGTAEENSETKARHHSDNSLAQYGALGLKSASLLGASFDRKIFVREAKRWLKHYVPIQGLSKVTVWDDGRGPAAETEDDEKENADKPDSKTKGHAKSGGSTRQRIAEVHPGYWYYWAKKVPKEQEREDIPRSMADTQNMTPAGISSLNICRDEIAIAGLYERELDIEIQKALAGAMAGMARKYPFREFFLTNDLNLHRDAHGSLYGMYGVERAGVLSGALKIGHIHWYVEGSQLLIQSQSKEGNWPDFWQHASPNARRGPASRDQHHLCNTAFAILFLKAAAIPTPTAPQKRSNLTGGGGEEHRAEKEGDEKNESEAKAEGSE